MEYYLIDLLFSNNQKNTHDSFLKKVEKLSKNKDKNGNICSLVSDKFIDFCHKNKDIIFENTNL